MQRFEPALVSEHACWGHVDGEHFNDLLPLPYTEEAALHLAARVREVQDFLGRQILVENLSAYVSFAHSQLTEGEFLALVVERSGCGLLLDVNNAYVNAANLGLDLRPTSSRHCLRTPCRKSISRDTHADGSVRATCCSTTTAVPCADVWTLYESTLQRLGPVPTLIEWDNDVPALDTLLAEAARADRLLRQCTPAAT